jgi:hypothetical protein
MVYVAAVNGYLLAASATVTAAAGLIGFIPPIRIFFAGFFARRRKENDHRTLTAPVDEESVF